MNPTERDAIASERGRNRLRNGAKSLPKRGEIASERGRDRLRQGAISPPNRAILRVHAHVRPRTPAGAGAADRARKRARAHTHTHTHTHQLGLGLRTAPDFDRPFLSGSLRDFWSRRWNLNTGYSLRFLVYDPVVEGAVYI